MSDIINNPKNYLIEFKDRKKLWVTQRLYFQLLEDSATQETFYVDNNLYSFKAVKTMMTPQELNPFSAFPTIDRFMRDQTPQRRMHAIEQMAKGLKGYINDPDRYQGIKAPILLLEKMRRQYAQAKLELNQQNEKMDTKGTGA